MGGIADEQHAAGAPRFLKKVLNGTKVNLLGRLQFSQGFGHRTCIRGEARSQSLEPTLQWVFKRLVDDRIRVAVGLATSDRYEQKNPTVPGEERPSGYRWWTPDEESPSNLAAEARLRVAEEVTADG